MSPRISELTDPPKQSFWYNSLFCTKIAKERTQDRTVFYGCHLREISPARTTLAGKVVPPYSFRVEPERLRFNGHAQYRGHVPVDSMHNLLSTMHRPAFPTCTLLLIMLACSLQATAQEADEDRHQETYDNPVARAEFELMRRADPATGRIPAGIRKRELEFAATLPSREALASDAEKKGASIASAVTWRERGPANQGGRTRALAMDRENDSVILAGGVSGGMWRSDDLGQSWERTTDVGMIQSVTCVAQDTRPGGGNVWYYGTGEYGGNSASLPGDGIFKSTDGGHSWFPLASTTTNTPQTREGMFENVYTIAVDPSNLEQDEVYAACYGGIVRSTDGGETWKEVLGSYENGAAYTDIDITPDGTIYATLSSRFINGIKGIWRSEDGINWTDITPADFPPNFGMLEVAIAPSNTNVVYVFGESRSLGESTHNMWVYNHAPNGQGTWENRSQVLPDNMNTYYSYCTALRVKPDDEDVVFVGGMRCFRTTDGFRDPNNLYMLMGVGSHFDQHEYFFFPSDPNSLVAAHDGGVSMSHDAGQFTFTWTSLNNGYATMQFYTVTIDRDTEGSDIIIGGAQDNGTWYVNNDEEVTEWHQLEGADGSYCAIADGGESLYFSYQQGGIFRGTFDDETKERNLVRIDPEGATGYHFINPFVLDRADNRIMYLPTSTALWRNNDLTAFEIDNSRDKKSKNWEQVPIPELPSRTGISIVASSMKKPAHRLYYGTTQGRLYRMDSAHSSSPTVVAIDSTIFPLANISSIWVNPNDGDELLVAISNYNVLSIFYSSDAGITWDTVSGNLEQYPDGSGNGPSVSWVEGISVNGSKYFLAGTSTGLYSTTSLNGSETVWVQEGASTIGNVVVDMIAVRESDGFVAVGTHGKGAFTGYVLDAIIEANLTVSNSTVNFGKVKVGSTAYDTVTVASNSSSERNVVGDIPQPAGPFRVVSGAGPLTLGPGASRELILEFVPTEVGLISEPLRIQHDATSPSNPSTIWLTGEGIATGSVNAMRPDENQLRLRGTPNPFTREVVIAFDLEKPTEVTLTIVTPDGEEIESLMDGRQESGQNEVVWRPGADVPNGTYFVRLQAGGKDRTVSNLLLRLVSPN